MKAARRVLIRQDAVLALALVGLVSGALKPSRRVRTPKGRTAPFLKGCNALRGKARVSVP
jgi:hypothetical protein